MNTNNNTNNKNSYKTYQLHQAQQRNKISVVWVLLTFIILSSIAFANTSEARTVLQYYADEDIKKQQLEVDFPVLNNWPAGGGENAVWINSRQRMDAIGMDGLLINGPIYKTNLNARSPITKFNNPKRIYRQVSNISLFSWD